MGAGGSSSGTGSGNASRGILRRVRATNGLDFKWLRSSPDICRVQRIGKLHNVTSCGLELFTRGDGLGAIVVPLDRNKGQRATENGDVGVSDEHGPVGICSLLAIPPEGINTLGDPPAIRGRLSDGKLLSSDQRNPKGNQRKNSLEVEHGSNYGRK